jgi:hypothetical protein
MLTWSQGLTWRQGRVEFQGYVALTLIFFAGFCASAVFGSVTLRIPFSNVASILSISTPSGRSKYRSNQP